VIRASRTLLLNAMGNPVPGCTPTADTAAAVAACDSIDGVRDGVIGDPKRCNYDPKQLVGPCAAIRLWRDTREPGVRTTQPILFAVKDFSRQSAATAASLPVADLNR
jgi:hypothetical protein